MVSGDYDPTVRLQITCVMIWRNGEVAFTAKQVVANHSSTNLLMTQLPYFLSSSSRSVNLSQFLHHPNMASDTDYVTLVSSDGFSFVVQRSSACLSGAIKRMLDPACAYGPLWPGLRMFTNDLQMGLRNRKRTPAILKTSSMLHRL